MSPEPWDPPLLTKGEWNVEIALGYLRAGLREPLPEVTLMDNFARLYASALADYGLVDDDNRRKIGEALLLMSSQLAAQLMAGPRTSPMGLLNILSLAGMHVYDDGELRQCGHEWHEAVAHVCSAPRGHEPGSHACMCGAKP